MFVETSRSKLSLSSKKDLWSLPEWDNYLIETTVYQSRIKPILLIKIPF